MQDIKQMSQYRDHFSNTIFYNFRDLIQISSFFSIISRILWIRLIQHSSSGIAYETGWLDEREKSVGGFSIKMQESFATEIQFSIQVDINPSSGIKKEKKVLEEFWEIYLATNQKVPLLIVQERNTFVKFCVSTYEDWVCEDYLLLGIIDHFQQWLELLEYFRWALLFSSSESS